jgi:response regulator RpfG family c-di-GMP phosphodiesterase
LEDIIKLLADEKGKHFDPKVVDAFMVMLPRILEFRDEECD